MAKWWKILLVICMLVISVGCTGDEQQPAEVLFYGESDHWIAEYRTNPAVSDHETATLHFIYKGSISELSEASRFVFSYGTSVGSIAETMNFESIDTAYFAVDFEQDLIQEIAGKPDEHVRVIVKWGGISESMDLLQYEARNRQ